MRLDRGQRLYPGVDAVDGYVKLWGCDQGELANGIAVRCGYIGILGRKLQAWRVKTAVDTSAISAPTLHCPYPPYHTRANSTSSAIHDANNVTPTNVWHLTTAGSHSLRRSPPTQQLVSFSRRETVLFEISEFMSRTRAAAAGVDSTNAPRSPQQDLHELNAGLLGGEISLPFPIWVTDLNKYSNPMIVLTDDEAMATGWYVD
ncbi:hypothetical protein BDP27DRAFT_1430447 [Rhodocollybia butyracea]|uniref:Uncharacterized protein n=1 Tax=Rhodocollybia butyracea TaxID=206335 RepID=A0A9P5TZ98_9AGAR|nr:hypothetical protein BDP27DRAFT_1430447 [Rhodocollybia butyracea]